MEKKKCNICSEVKDLDEFTSIKKYGKQKGHYIYYFPYCRKCNNKKAERWREENREKWLEINKKRNNKEDFSKFRKEYSKIQRESGYSREWQRKNKDKIKIYNGQHENHNINDSEWEIIKGYFNWACAYCGISETESKIIHNQNLHKDHVDHNGNNEIDNCVPACRKCNTSKHDKPFKEWYNENNPIFSQDRLNKIVKWVTEDFNAIDEIDNSL